MGYDVRTHMKHYGQWTDEAGLDAAFGAANAKLTASLTKRQQQSSSHHIEDSVRMTAYQPIQRKLCKRSDVFWVPSPHVRTVSEEARGLQRSR